MTNLVPRPIVQMMRPADQQAMKSFFIELVLATDMKRHFNIVSHFQVHPEDAV